MRGKHVTILRANEGGLFKISDAGSLLLLRPEDKG